jgi:hypothetical protein
MDLQADYDGEPRTVRMDAVLDLLFRYYEDQTEEVLCDAYSLSQEIVPQRQSHTWDHVQQVSDSRTRVAGRMKLEETDPKILQVMNYGARLHLDHTEKKENGLGLLGNVELWVLYAAEDDSRPMACVTQNFPYEHTAEMQNTELQSSWQIQLSLDQLMVGMLDAGELEMKAVLQIQIIFRNTEEVTLVEDLEENPPDMERLKQMPGLVIHVVQPGETLWDISRDHATTCENVMKLNELKEEAVTPGCKLLLVKELGSRPGAGK